MDNRKTLRRNISNRLLRTLSADEQEREREDRIRAGWDEEEEVPTENVTEPEEPDDETATEMGLHRHPV